MRKHLFPALITLMLWALFNACAGETVVITDQCRFSSRAGGSPKLFYDDIRYKDWNPADKNDTLTITIPQDLPAGAIFIEWSVVPQAFTATCFGEKGEVLYTFSEQGNEGLYAVYEELDPAVKRIEIAFASKNVGICELNLYEYGACPENPQRWRVLPEKVDLLVVSAHQDDELLFFGGTIPYYCVNGKVVAVAYIADCGRTRYAEALEGLWRCREPYHPIFIGFADKRLTDYTDTLRLWGPGKTLTRLVSILRKYKPEVVVTHDEKGEYGHMQHIVASKLVRDAVLLAADPDKHPDSRAEYGAWTVKKLYLHLGDENVIHMNWDAPLPGFNGETAMSLATDGYRAHRTQQHLYQMENQGVQYDNTRFSLVYTTVGADARKDDFFEHID